MIKIVLILNHFKYKIKNKELLKENIFPIKIYINNQTINIQKMILK